MNRNTWVAVLTAAAVLAPLAAEAMCQTNATRTCRGRNNCLGTSDCGSGYWSPCVCDPVETPCTICNRQSTINPVTNKCRPLTEMCNACDDDVDGQIDDGLYCVGTGPFVPVCTTTGTLQSIAFNMTSMDLPTNPENGAQYANNLSYRARFHFNPKVQTFKLMYSSRNVDFSDAFFSTVRGVMRDEHGASNTKSTYALNGSGLQGMDLTFTSNISLQSSGFILGLGEATCGVSGPTGASPLSEDGPDTYAVLTGSEDVVFFAIPMGSDPISVWAEGPPGISVDADLYARVGALPERNVFDFKSATAGHSDEWINVDFPQAGKTLFVAVHSRSGGGAVNLRWARVTQKNTWSSKFGTNNSRPLRVGLNFRPNATQLTSIDTLLRGSQRFMVGASEGKVQLREIELWGAFAGPTNCTCGTNACDACIHVAPGRASCIIGTTLTASNWAPASGNIFFDGSRVMVHELGHCLFGFPDEYRDHGSVLDFACTMHPDTKCTHSIMGSSRAFTNNLCGPLEHGRDPTPIGHVCATCPQPEIFMLPGQSCTIPGCNACFSRTASMWSMLVSSGDVRSMPAGTPNNKTYEFYRGMPFTVVTR